MYIHITYIQTHIFPASVATSSISFLLNATGRFLVIISLTHPRKGFEKKQLGCNCFVDFHPGMTLDSSAWGQKSLYAPGGPVHLLTGKTCDLSGKIGSKPWLVELPGRVWKFLSFEFCFIHVFVGYVPPRLGPQWPKWWLHTSDRSLEDHFASFLCIKKPSILNSKKTMRDVQLHGASKNNGCSGTTIQAAHTAGTLLQSSGK